jgi:riboflavin biosynthesis pyrimidine reductase
VAGSPEFAALAARKTREAETADIRQLTTTLQESAGWSFLAIGNAWTRAHYDGDFKLFVPPDERPGLSLVFVQSADRNTASPDPSLLGGGATDTHLIYEGLSRVAADAVLAGAGTIHRESFFSVWHPELVRLRLSLGLPRHPAQIVISKKGRFDFSAVLFNVPDVPVFLIAGAECLRRCRRQLMERPWIRCIPMVGDDISTAMERLHAASGLRRISAVGGRSTASRLVDAALAQDLYLTTTSKQGGEPGTPWYSGPTPPRLDVVSRKEWTDSGSPLMFEHFLINRAGSG